MKRYLLLLCLTAIFSKTFYGQTQEPLKREPYKLKIAVDKNTFYEEDIVESAYIHPNNTVQLYPGETIYIEVEKEKNVIKSMTAVKENTHPEKTITISFSQEKKGNVHESMTLKVINPFSEKLVYEAKMFLMKRKAWVDTDVYPVEPKLIGYEIWPDIITSIGLAGWSLK